MVEQIEAGTVVARCQPPRRDRHPDAVRNPLAERAGGGLDPRRMPQLGMTGGAAVELAEVLDVVERDRQPALLAALGPGWANDPTYGEKVARRANAMLGLTQA